MSAMAHENIIFGGPVDKSFTADYRSLGDFLLTSLSQHGDATAVIDGFTDKKITYREIKEGGLRMAEYFRRLGIKSGDIVGIISENCLEYTVIVTGAFIVGAAVTTFNVTYVEDELKHALNLIKPSIVFASPYAIYNMTMAVESCPFVKMVLQFGEVPLVEGAKLFNDVFNDPHLKGNLDFKPAPMDLDNHVGMIMLSSGTTGLPKGVQITATNILAVFSNAMESRRNLNMEDDVILLSIIPWFHVYGLITMVQVICSGIQLVMLPKFEEENFLSAIQKYRPTHSFMVPPLILFLAKHPLVDKFDLSSLQELYCGAAPLSQEVEEATLKRLPHINIIRQGYGMSETTLGVLSAREAKSKPGSVGIVSQGVYCKVIDPDTGKALGPYQRGELCFKGNVIMKGYIGNEQATKETIDNEGWLHTGDVAYYDSDRYFFIVDRLKELIKYKAFQVAPAELEAILLTHPAIEDAAVIGKPDEASGELPLAFVVKRAEAKVSAGEIQEFVAAKVSPSKRLRGGVRFINEIPKNLSGKILRRDLRVMLQSKSKL